MEDELEVIEKNAVRVRIEAKSCFTWWDKYADKDLRVTATYTFYRVGRIIIGVHVENKGDRTFRWSNEYGPHLDLPGWDESRTSTRLSFFGHRTSNQLDRRLPVRAKRRSC